MLDLVSVLVRTGLASSNGEARRLLSQGGVSVNGRKVSGDGELGVADLLHGQVVLLRKGKSTYHLVAAADARLSSARAKRLPVTPAIVLVLASEGAGSAARGWSRPEKP